MWSRTRLTYTHDAEPTPVSDEFIYSPEDFDPANYPGFLAQHPDAARWFLNVIFYRRVTRNLSKTDFVQLHSDYLGSMLGDQALVKPTRIALEEHGLIECDESYLAGKSSMSYRTGPALEHASWRRYDCIGKRMKKRFSKFRDAVTSPVGFAEPVHEHLAGWCRQVTVDGAAAAAVVEGFRDVPLGKRKIPKHELAAFQVDAITRGLLHLTVCKFGRFHTNFSNLCQELRSCLRYQGRPLAEIDVRNSQPFFLAGLILEEWSRENWGKGEGNRGKQTGRKGDTKSLWFGRGIPEDLGLFVEDACLGRFYERFAEVADVSRDQAKTETFLVLFGKTLLMEHTAVGRAFRGVYPTASQLLKAIKMGQGFRWVACELQRRESALVIGSVCERLRRDYPHVCVITVHDSIATPPEHLSLVEGILRAEFARFPRQPMFRIKGNVAPAYDRKEAA